MSSSNNFISDMHTSDLTMNRNATGSHNYLFKCIRWHYNDVIMTTIASQITSLTVVYSTIYSDADQRKHQSSALLAFVWGIHRDRWIPRTKVQLCGNVSIWWRHHGDLADWTLTCSDFFKLWNKQRVLMHRHQGWNVRHGLCHIYMRYLYIYELFIAFVCFVVCSLL